MSVDLWMEKKPCHTCGCIPDVVNYNYTYNVAKMWYLAYPEDSCMVNIDGMTGKEAWHKLTEGYNRLKEKEQEARKLEPEHGWGSYTGFLEFLTMLIVESKNNPDEVWQTWR